MSGEWKQCKWGDLATLEYGRSLRGYENASGQFPVYGTNGLSRNFFITDRLV
jgi:type I restriction enzyme S subunit